MNEKSNANEEPLAEAAAGVLREMLGRAGFEPQVEASETTEGDVTLQVGTPDAARLIGRGAQMLDAVEFLLNRILQHQRKVPVHCTVDVEGYRGRRADQLVDEATVAARQVRRTGEPYAFPPMNARDRRTVHQALKNEPDLVTESDEPDAYGRKRLVVHPAGKPVGPPAEHPADNLSPDPQPPAGDGPEAMPAAGE